MTLGFFSFAKFLMYRDLDVRTWPDAAKLVEHPARTGLLRDGFPASDRPFAEDVKPGEAPRRATRRAGRACESGQAGTRGRARQPACWNQTAFTRLHRFARPARGTPSFNGAALAKAGRSCAAVRTRRSAVSKPPGPAAP